MRYLYLPTPHPHLPFSFHLFWIWLLSSLSWKRLQHDSSQDALGPVLVITWFLFMLFDVSAAFDRVNHLLLLKTFSSSASPALYSASLMVSSQPFLAGCFSAVWFSTVRMPQDSSLTIWYTCFTYSFICLFLLKDSFKRIESFQLFKAIKIFQSFPNLQVQDRLLCFLNNMRIYWQHGAQRFWILQYVNPTEPQNFIQIRRWTLTN